MCLWSLSGPDPKLCGTETWPYKANSMLRGTIESRPGVHLCGVRVESNVAMRRISSLSMVLLLLFVAVVPAWSAPALPECCVRAVNVAAPKETKHEHCAGMKMGAQSAPETTSAQAHQHDYSSPAISKLQLNCRCAMSLVSGVISPLPTASRQEILPTVYSVANFRNPVFIARLNSRNHSERGPPALLQSQS
jgi:hypothetical protein